MDRQAQPGLKTILRLAPSLLRRPGFGSSLARLQAARWGYNLRLPKSHRGGRIHQVSIRITDLCNLRCRTCGQWGENGYLLDKSPAELKKREVDPDRYSHLLHDLKADGHRPGVYLWGGEPLLYEGTVELLEEAAGLGLPGSIATNGTGLADKASQLAGAPLFLVQVSLDGPNPEIHNAARPSSSGRDNYSAVINGLEALGEERRARRQGLPLIATLTTINRFNQDRLVEIHEAVGDKVDLMVFYLSWWIDEARAEAHTGDFSDRFGFEPKCHYGWIGGWRPGDFDRLSGQLKTLVKKGAGRSGPAVVILPALTAGSDLTTYYTDHGARFGYNRCVSIYSAVEIDSNGDMSPCRDYHDYVVGNVKDRTISQLWNDPAYLKFRKSLSGDGLMPVCSRCCGLMGY